MRCTFPLFQSHLDLAHRYWGTLLEKGNIAIDATCGNGHDALALARLTLADDAGMLVVIDIQEAALNSARERLQHSLSEAICQRIEFIHGCHSAFPAELQECSVKLVVYNLGYLPGGDKSKTTATRSTLVSIRNAMPLVCSGGAISITCYPGHPEGAAEEATLLDFATTLPPTQWSCCHHRWLNRHASPSLILLQKG